MDLKKQILQERLKSFLKGREIDICFNNNKQTIIRVIKVTKKSALISLHEMFLEASSDVLKALVYYIFSRGRHQTQAKRTLKGFIELQFQSMDLSSDVKKEKMHTLGDVYDLGEIYEDVNEDYFSGDLDLSITWFGRKLAKRRRSITCGLFDHPHRLIKVHKQLDQPIIPKYYLEFIVYHEMLHFVIPPYKDDNGMMCIHSQEFKEREQSFKQYSEVKHWEKSNPKVFFK